MAVPTATAPNGIIVPRSQGKPSMGKSTEKSASVARIGLDLAKNVFQAHGVDVKGGVVLARKVLRGEDWRELAREPWFQSISCMA